MPLTVADPIRTPPTHKLRVALVGCGRISQSHFAALKQHAERAELVAVCDNQPAQLTAAVAATGAQGFDSLDALLAGSDAEIVATAELLAAAAGFTPARAGQR